MEHGIVYDFKIFGHEAIVHNRRMEISLPDYELATKVLLRVGNLILDKKLRSLRINLPDKLIFVRAHDKQQLAISCEDLNNRGNSS